MVLSAAAQILRRRVRRRNGQHNHVQILEMGRAGFEPVVSKPQKVARS
jgi:hypothetical protein